MQITSLTNSEIYNSDRRLSVEKTKSDNFESLLSSTQSTNKTTTPNTQEKEIVIKSSTQSLYEDIISLLRTGFTVGELKAFEERLKEILKMKEDKDLKYLLTDFELRTTGSTKINNEFSYRNLAEDFDYLIFINRSTNSILLN